ncbi:MAG TPA: PrpF domain-containing protein [Acidimicrobiales bacterium]
MTQRSIPAVFMRGGTSKGLMLHARDLPDLRDTWAPLLCAAMGSPDENGRQLNGMGGGLSSLSKVCVLAPSTRHDADVNFTFAQVMIKEARVDYRANCGNMSSAVGPFVFDEGLVRQHDGQCVVRIHNTNTDKIIRSTFDVDGRYTRYEGDLAIPGVSGTGAPIRLDFLEPGGATTGRLLPTGDVTDWIELSGRDPLEVSLIDAANAAVFVRARDVGLRGNELPHELDAREEVLPLLEGIRRAASVRMGISADLASASTTTSVPFVCVVSESDESTTLSGEVIGAAQADLLARVISSGQPHRALPLTIALCTAVAARLEGSVVHQSLGDAHDGPLRLAMPSGLLGVDADVQRHEGEWTARSGTFYRTARRLFDGRVWIPSTNLD